MEYRTDDLRIREIKEVLTPETVLGEFPITEGAAETVYQTSFPPGHHARPCALSHPVERTRFVPARSTMAMSPPDAGCPPERSQNHDWF